MAVRAAGIGELVLNLKARSWLEFLTLFAENNFSEIYFLQILKHELANTAHY
jgi:hypothetical protein